MISRIILLLIAVALIMAVIGKLRRLKMPRRASGKAVTQAHKCPGCGAYVVGSGAETCGRPECRIPPDAA